MEQKNQTVIKLCADSDFGSALLRVIYIYLQIKILCPVEMPHPFI